MFLLPFTLVKLVATFGKQILNVVFRISHLLEYLLRQHKYKCCADEKSLRSRSRN